MERQRMGRAASDLLFLVDRLVDFVIEFLAGFFEFTHAAAETAGEFRQLLGAEEQEHDDEDDHHLLAADSGEGVVEG
jgi:hypothetical protein